MSEKMISRYKKYRLDCLADQNPPLTLSEWQKEGCLTYGESLARSEEHRAQKRKGENLKA